MRTGSLRCYIGLAPYFDYNLGLISAGVPRIDDVKGNVFTECFLANETCCTVLKNELPERDTIIIYPLLNLKRQKHSLISFLIMLLSKITLSELMISLLLLYDL